jgi:poly(beta-D-mannuronate) lyase
MLPMETRYHLALLVALVFVGAGTGRAGDGSLRAPFAQRRPLAAQSLPFSGCPPVPAPQRDLEAVSFYTDASHAVIDQRLLQRNLEAVRPVRQYVREVARMADGHLLAAPNDTAFAACALRWLGTWGSAEALLGKVNQQGAYERVWTLAGLALAYLKIRDAAGLDAGQQQGVRDWLRKLALAIQPGYERPQRLDNWNNHSYWAGLAAAAAGVAVDDKHLFEWGLERYAAGVAQITADGTLPLEMARRQRALHYHLFALTPLVMLAELGQVNGRDLYELDHGALHRLVHRMLSGLGDPRGFERATGSPQLGIDRLPADDMGWMEPYYARFKAPELLPWLMRYRPIVSERLGGDLTLAFAP